MAFCKVERAGVDARPAQALRNGLASAARRRRQIAMLLGGAILMAAAGALAGSQMRLDTLVMRPANGPHLRVRPGQGGGQHALTTQVRLAMEANA